MLYFGKMFRKSTLALLGGDIIYVQNWNGDKIAMMKNDKMLKKICLSKDGKSMYTIAYNPYPVLVQFLLLQWQ